MKLGEGADEDLADFCAVHYGCPKKNVIRLAVAAFIKNDLANNRGIREAFYARKAARAGVVVIQFKGKDKP